MSSETSDSGVETRIEHSIHVYLDLTDCGGSLDGIDLCVNGGDSYAISVEGARAIAALLEKAAAEREAK